MKRGWLYALILIVFGFWGSCLIVALVATGGDLTQMSAFGQLGDTFGSVNALFTGLALVGVAYGVMLQLKQNADQEKEAENRRAADKLQSQENYLTARLNATMALLQAHESSAKLIEGHGYPLQSYYQDEAKRETLKLRQSISLLLFEARLGFKYDNQKQTMDAVVHEYLKQFLAEMESRLADPHSDYWLYDVETSIQYLRKEVPQIRAFVLSDHNENSALMSKLIDRLSEIENSVRERVQKKLVVRHGNITNEDMIRASREAYQEVRTDLIDLIKATRDSLG